MTAYWTLPHGRLVTPWRRVQKGFTLLEVLVVVFIVGIILSVAVISIPADKEKALQTEAERIDALIGLAQQEAIIRDRELALEVKSDGYRFLIQDEASWTPMPDSNFRPRSLEEPMQLELVMEGIPLLTRDEGQDSDGEDDQAPRIFILSSGELSQFTISVAHPEVPVEFLIHGDISGRHSVEKKAK